MGNFVRWDFLGSVLAAGAFLVAVMSSDRPLDEATGPLAAAVSLGLALSLGAAVASRWLGDSSKDDTYGEVLRAIDPESRRAQKPFVVVVVVGLATAALGALLLITQDEFSRTATAWLYALEVLLASYGLLGMLDLLLLGFRHQRRQSILRALREQEKRRRGPGGG